MNTILLHPNTKREHPRPITQQSPNGRYGAVSPWKTSVRESLVRPEVDAAYIYLTDESLMPGRDSIACEVPEGTNAMVVLDWKNGRIVGLEVMDASHHLHPDLLQSATPKG